MDLNSEELGRRWKIIQEQLISLWAFHKKSPVANEFSNFLTEGFSMSIMSLSMFTQICYFLLGLINKEERDKLIKWPVINIQGQVKFRKGVSAIVKGLIEKYPHVSLQRLPESYLIEPSHNQNKILDFIMKLANLAVYLAVNDPLVFEMRTGNDLNASEIETALTMIRRARIHEEKIIEANTFPIAKFENIRMSITNKCVSLKQENSNLNNKFNKLKKKLLETKIVQKEDDCNVDYLKDVFNEKLNEALEMNKELKVYSDISKEIVSNLNSSGEPVSLSAEDFGLSGEEGENLIDATAEAYEKLLLTFDSMKCKDSLPKEKEDYFKILERLRNALLKEKNSLQSFLIKYNGDGVNCTNL